MVQSVISTLVNESINLIQNHHHDLWAQVYIFQESVINTFCGPSSGWNALIKIINESIANILQYSILGIHYLTVDVDVSHILRGRGHCVCCLFDFLAHVLGCGGFSCAGLAKYQNIRRLISPEGRYQNGRYLVNLFIPVQQFLWNI